MIYIDEREFLYCECDEKYVYSVPFSNEYMCMYVCTFYCMSHVSTKRNKRKKRLDNVCQLRLIKKIPVKREYTLYYIVQPELNEICSVDTLIV